MYDFCVGCKKIEKRDKTIASKFIVVFKKLNLEEKQESISLLQKMISSRISGKPFLWKGHYVLTDYSTKFGIELAKMSLGSLFQTMDKIINLFKGECINYKTC